MEGIRDGDRTLSMRQKFFGAMIVATRGHGQLGFVSHYMFQARLGDGAQRAVVQKWASRVLPAVILCPVNRPGPCANIATNDPWDACAS